MNVEFYSTCELWVGLALALLVGSCLAGVPEISDSLTLTSRVAVTAKAARVRCEK